MAGDTREIEVACPCCRARLAVDVRTEKVLRWSRPEETDAAGRPVVSEADWSRAQERVAGRLDEAQDAFGAALDRERRRSRDLDNLFQKASGRALSGPGGGPGEEAEAQTEDPIGGNENRAEEPEAGDADGRAG